MRIKSSKSRRDDIMVKIINQMPLTPVGMALYSCLFQHR